MNGSPEKPHSSDPSRNTTTPKIRMTLRPNRSESFP